MVGLKLTGELGIATTRVVVVSEERFVLDAQAGLRGVGSDSRRNLRLSGEASSTLPRAEEEALKSSYAAAGRAVR